MKKTFQLLFAIAFMAFAFTGCSDVPEPYNVPTQTTNDDNGMGTKDNPFDVTNAIKKVGTANIYIKGYIVGYALYTEGVGNTFTFSAEGAGNSNFMIAASPDETNPANCMPVALPTAVRSALNLKDHPENLKKEVTLYGNIVKYFGQPGIKETSFAIIDGKTTGTDPEGSGSDDTSTETIGSKDAPLTIAQAI